MINIGPFYIGQEIVAIKDHSQGVFKKGDEFIVKGMKSSTCNCERRLINIGIQNTSLHTQCRHCGVISIHIDRFWWFNINIFAPKIEFSKFVSMKQVTEEALETIGAN